jgi:hypothetical protein
MRVTKILVTAMLVLGPTAVAHATNMVTGPLFPNGAADSCACEIVNISTGTKIVDIQVLNKGGGIIQHQSSTLAPGAADTLNSGVAGLQYCKFVNASPVYFRATISCVFNGTDVVAQPAR